MMILDSSAVIAFYHEMKNPIMLYKVCNLGCKLVVPVSVYGELKGKTSEMLKEAVKEGKIDVYSDFNRAAFLEIKNRHPNLKNGEIEVITIGQNCKNNGTTYWCILDDKLARKTADSYDLEYMGTWGLLDYLTDNGEITSDEREEMHERLQVSNFRIKSR